MAVQMIAPVREAGKRLADLQNVFLIDYKAECVA